MDDHYLSALVREQENEISAHHIYLRLAEKVKSPENQGILRAIAADEIKHYRLLKYKTEVEVEPSRFKVWFYYLISVVLGLTFGIKLLERDEGQAIDKYRELGGQDPDFWTVLQDEERHETELIAMIDEERLRYLGAIVLGLNDALVELTGALAGYTFAFQNSRLIALTGLITGIAASFSMAAAGYLSSKQDSSTGESIKSAMYTGAAYVVTVVLLILPYLLIQAPYVSLVVTLVLVLLVIFIFNFYVAVAKDLDFRERFLEMAAISLGVAAASFLVSILVKNIFGIDI
ncbi:MAG: rubrerythrin family protein [Syntrophomonadaceae bacterium]|nr:rubrerythrin family protein [Syntrophomonadaceae bacterium]